MRLVLGLELKDRADLGDGGLMTQHGDEGHLLLKLFTESKEKSIYLGVIFNMIAELLLSIADRFDVLTENDDRRTALAASA
jgi:hypothetical protein